MLQVDSSLSEPPGKPQNIGVGIRWSLIRRKDVGWIKWFCETTEVKQVNLFIPYFCCLESMRPCCCLVTQSCSTLCDPMDGSLPDSSVHGIS